MTPTTKPSSPRRRVRKLAKHPTMAVAWQSATIIACLVAVATFVLTFVVPHSAGSPGPSSASSGPSGTSTPSSPSTNHSSSAAPVAGAAKDSVGRCWIEEGDPVPCDDRHTLETFAQGNACSAGSLYSYLGGSATDVLASTLRAGPSVDGYCHLRVPYGKAVTSSLAGGLQRPTGDVLRSCVDGNTKAEVPCTQSHAAEVVFRAPISSVVTANCAGRAQGYLAEQVSAFASQLTVGDRRRGFALECVVTVRGHNVLTASLRNIGTRELPLAPAP